MCLFLSKIDYNQQRINPRLRGEKESGSSAMIKQPGSPPPTRGKGHRDRICAAHRGITPAYAGKSERLPARVVQREDHPRLRGEKHGL